MLNEVSPVEPLPRHYGIVSMMAAQSIFSFPPSFSFSALPLEGAASLCINCRRTLKSQTMTQMPSATQSGIAEDKSQTDHG